MVMKEGGHRIGGSRSDFDLDAKLMETYVFVTSLLS